MITSIIRRAVPITQLSMPRSGGTLVNNILREIFPDKKIKKVHRYKQPFRKSPVVVTYRHPLDAMASTIRLRYGNPPVDDIVIQQQLGDIGQQGIQDIIEIRHAPHVLMLRYELFRDDFHYIYDAVESFFGIRISAARRALISEKYHVETVHYYPFFFSLEQIFFLNQTYQAFMNAFSYEGASGVFPRNHKNRPATKF